MVGFALLAVSLLILSVVFRWAAPGHGEGGRVAFGLNEAVPFVVLAILFLVAAWRLFGLSRWAWWLAVFGAGAAIVHGVYRFYLAPANVPGSSTPWISSNPGGLLTLTFGVLVLALCVTSRPAFWAVVERAEQ